jgi:hypothetical protein
LFLYGADNLVESRTQEKLCLHFLGGNLFKIPMAVKLLTAEGGRDGMRLRTYVGGILIKLLALMLIAGGLLLSLYSDSLSQQTSAPIELYSIMAWIIFLAGLIVFVTSVIIQRNALRRLKTRKWTRTL